MHLKVSYTFQHRVYVTSIYSVFELMNNRTNFLAFANKQGISLQIENFHFIQLHVFNLTYNYIFQLL